MGGIKDTANIIYDALTFKNSMDAVTKAENAMKSAVNTMNGLVSYMSKTPEAGGSLSIGGSTVLGMIKEHQRRVNMQYETLQSGRKKLEIARGILGGIGKVFNVFTGGLLGSIKGLIEKGANYTSDFIDALSTGDPSAILESAFGLGGVVASAVTGESMLANTGDAYHALDSADKHVQNVNQQTIDAYHSGDIGLGETLSSSVVGSVSAGVVGVTDAALNLIDIDIPDSVVNWIIDAGATAGGWVGSGIDYVWSRIF